MYSDHPDHSFLAHNDSPLFVTLSGWLNILLFSGLIFLLSCKETNAVQQEELYGKWDIHKAMRNGVETDYLRGGYFIIDPNGSMTVNITGTEEKGAYVLDGNWLRLNNEKDFMVETMRRDSMSIRYTMNGENSFLFFLTRNRNEAH